VLGQAVPDRLNDLLDRLQPAAGTDDDKRRFTAAQMATDYFQYYETLISFSGLGRAEGAREID
jgi:hypothetical protein